ncbi:MAG TPA: hypothetical protein PLW50_00865 [Smithellaceae bacterium]|jgi:hypothetical protein|nr:hypothetical protein [Smithellaceae bacterium]
MNGRALGLLIMVISAVLFIYFVIFVGGIVFAAECTAKYNTGTEVILTATPCPGSYFVRWDGACAGQGAICKVKMDGDKQTSAVFEPIPFPQNLRLLDFTGFTPKDLIRCDI